MLSIVEVVVPATEFKLMSVADAKIALQLTDTSQDQQLELLIERVSSMISVLCNHRVFAKETVVETFTGAPTSRLFLSRFPVRATDIESVVQGSTAIVNYRLDSFGGILYGDWSSPVEVFYTGGYALPEEAPKALQHATFLLLTSQFAETQQAMTTGSGIKSVSHGESTVTYMTPTEMSGRSSSGSTSGGSGTNKAVDTLLSHFTRYTV